MEWVEDGVGILLMLVGLYVEEILERMEVLPKEVLLILLKVLSMEEYSHKTTISPSKYILSSTLLKTGHYFFLSDAKVNKFYWLMMGGNGCRWYFYRV